MPLLAYDLTQKKVGCVLLQALMGGDRELCLQIPSEDWLVYLTPELKLYQLTDDQAAQLIAAHRK